MSCHVVHVSGRRVIGLRHLEKLLEVDPSGSVLVERAEDVFVEWSGFSFRKQSRVDRQELLPTEFTRRTVFLRAQTT